MGDSSSTSNPLDDLTTKWTGFETDKALDPSASTNYANSPGTQSMTYEQGIAEACAVACSDALEQVENVYYKVMNQSILQVQPAWFGVRADNLPVHCGADLAGQINEMIPDLEQILLSHQNILQAMKQTFIQAGSKYELTELLNAQGFKEDNASPSAMTTATGHTNSVMQAFTGGLTTTPQNSSQAQAVWQADPLAAKTAPAQYTKVAAWIPTGFSTGGKMNVAPDVWGYYSWDDCYSVGQKINPQSVANVAGNWQWMGNTLANAFTTMTDSILNIPEGSWTGSGWNGAYSAVKTYKDQANDLIEQINGVRGVSKNLHTVADFLRYVQLMLPKSPNTYETVAETTTMNGYGVPSTSYAYIKEPTNTPKSGMPYWQVLSGPYWAGVVNSSQALPVLQVPTQATGSGSGAGSNSGSGSGSGGAAGTPAAESAALAAAQNQANQEAAALTAAQNQASQQAAALTAAQKQDAATVAAENAVATSPTSAAITPADTSGSANGGSSSATDPSSLANEIGQVASAATQSAGQAIGAVQQAQAVNQAKQLAGDPGTVPGLDPNSLAAAAAMPALGGGGGGPGMAATAEDEAKQALGAEEAEAGLFPRATASDALGAEEAEASRAGAAPGSGYPMSPGGGGAGAGGKAQEKERQRNSGLDSMRHLGEAIEDNLVAVKPVLGAEQQ